MPCGCCLIAVAGSVVPRLTIGFLWIFTDLVQDAFNGFIVPLLGLIFVPFTTLTYVLFYWLNDGAITWGWVIIAMMVFVDIGTWATGGWKGRDASMPGTA